MVWIGGRGDGDSISNTDWHWWDGISILFDA